MKKIIINSFLICLGTLPALSQSAIDGFRLSQPDLKGTARFMSMGGAFGALGGDLSAIGVNPGGIGVYRNGDVGFTLDLDIQSSSSESQGSKYDMGQTKFYLNNIGTVLTLRLPSKACPNLNFGFTFNKSVSFNRKYGGNIPRLYNSMSNYIAGIANAEAITEEEISNRNAYNPGYGEYAPPWITILGYDGYLITPVYGNGETEWKGQWGEGTQGSGSFLVNEYGSVSDYNIVIGGNISNVVYWGMNFDIVNMNYGLNAVWGEELTDAYIPNKSNILVKESAQWNMQNFYSVNGTGFNYQIGVIVKPIQELRLGLAFHTPTWYHLTETFGANLNYTYAGYETGGVSTNGNLPGYNDVNFRSPMKLIASAAGVIGSSFILSFDYEWVPYNKMRYSMPSQYGGGYYDYWYDDPWNDWGYMKPAKAAPAGYSSVLQNNDPYYETNSDIQTYYTHSNTFRLGLEYRINPSFSVRAGYCNVSSPVTAEAKNDLLEIYTSGTMPNYRFDNSTNYVTCGLGYRYKFFYADLAYVYKHMNSTYHAYTPDVNSVYPSPQSNLSFINNQIVLSAGFRF